MFNVLKFSHDLITNATEVKVLFQTKPGGEIKTDGGNFTTEQRAREWLYQLKRDYFLIKVENFIMHKRHIIESSTGHKSLADKKISLHRCNDFLKWFAFQNPHLPIACKYLLEIEEHFNKIIPSSTNVSFQTSLDELNYIIKFARDHAPKNEIKKES